MAVNNSQGIQIIIPRATKNSLEIHTGDWRTLRPEFLAKESVCRRACPVASRVRDWLQLAAKEEFQEAWQMLVKTNPLPAVVGRVCPHFCENECLRKEFDEALAISALERVLGEMALEYGWRLETPPLSSDKKIAVIGAGPAGLSCAYQLRCRGYSVDIFESEKVIGGLLHLGIPEYRLPKEILKQEIEHNITSLSGINVHTDIKINCLLFPFLALKFSAVLVATGKNKSRKLKIRGEENNSHVISGLDFLKQINFGKRPDTGKIVAVIGGGNAAIDSARSAKRKGASLVFILYRRREEDMSAYEDEIRAAKEEGIEIKSLVAPVAIEEAKNGLIKIKCTGMDLGKPDKTGRPEPVPRPDSIVDFFASSAIVAIGEDSDLSFVYGGADALRNPQYKNVFIAGDAGGGGGTVAAAVGSGVKAAEEIDFYFKTGQRKENINGSDDKIKVPVVGFPDLNLEHFEREKRAMQELDLQNPQIGRDILRKEAKRCFSCGSCNDCGNCWLFCPDLAVLGKEDGGFEINYDYCKGCGICANECPRNVIEMRMEDK